MRPRFHVSPVVSYTTISPLPLHTPQAESQEAVYFLWHFPSTPI